ncbi:sensor histidine kinase [Euzebya sp.]|uniref:sensor histidine kinase n=1 Tax=Euzebya sp. TaxID=1971409 RepID=UPI003559E790
MRATASEAGVEIAVHRDAAWVQGDPDKLHQVVLNLLSYAIKFTPAGGAVTVTTREDDDAAVLDVDDTGPGMAADEAAHVFDLFWQGTVGGRTGGSGIDLAVAAELIAAPPRLDHRYHERGGRCPVHHQPAVAAPHRWPDLRAQRPGPGALTSLTLVSSPRRW